MRHNKWNKYLKIACSWILIFSMCFLSLNTVNASAEDTNAFESESETGDTEAFTSDTEISDTEIESEPSTDQFTSESEETKQETEKQIPDSIEVEQLNAEIQNRVANGEVPSTDRVKYVDEDGKTIEGAPTTIELGKISDHTEITIANKNYEFKSARVNGKDCVYIGKYNDTVYYSTDGVIAIKLDDGQKLTMTYQEYYKIRVNEEIPEGGVAGTITTKAGTVKVNTADTIRVNAGETWKFTVKTGTANKVRYKIGSVTAVDASTRITRVSGDEYEANYEANFQKDDTVTIAYDKEGVYRVTINRTASDGTEYLNEEHSKDALNFTFTENDLDAERAIDIPVIHTKRGYRLINMAINGTTLAGTTDNNVEIPTEEGTGHGITMDANCGDTSYLVTVVMEKRFTTHLGGEKDCSYEYSIKIKLRRGNWQDINLNLVPYKTGQQVLTVKLYTGSGHRSGDGLDVAMWNPDTKKLDPIHDSDTVNMDSVGSLAETLHKRQVRIFFAKSKNGYSSPDGAFKVFGNEISTGGRVIAETGEVSQLSATTMGETGTLEIYDEIWQEAKNAAQAAGYTEYVAFAGEKTLNTDWEMYVVSFTTTKIDYYVHYKSGLEDDLAVSNIPDNQELYNKRPMHSYGDNPETVANEGRSIGVSFTVGEGNEVPTCSGYEFLGWKLQKKDGTLSSETYQNNDVFTVSEDNVEYADNTNLPFCSRNDKVGYQFVAQWKKIDTKKVEVKHWLKVPGSTEKLGKTTAGTISFATENESVKAYAKPEANGTFPGYVFDTEDSRNKKLEKEVKNDSSSGTITINLYYKPTVLTVSKTVTGYNMEPNRSYEFTIKAVTPSGTDASTATITDGQIFIRKGTDDKVQNLTFTNNKATFNLAKDEFVDISCLPTGWTYTVTETDPGKNYKTSYKLNDSDATDGRAAEFKTSTTGNDEVTFTNASTVAPPETGRTIHDSEWILLLIVILVISAGGMTFLRKMKKRY